MDIDARVRVLEEALEAKRQEMMEQDLRNELRRADAEAAKEKAAQEEARIARVEADEARTAREHAARVSEQTNVVLAKATTLETEYNVGGCVRIEGADTGNKNYNPAPVEERSDVEWVGDKTKNNTKLLDGPWRYEEAGETTKQSGKDYNNKSLLEEQRHKRPPPERDQERITSEGEKRQKVSAAKQSPSTWISRGCVRLHKSTIYAT